MLSVPGADRAPRRGAGRAPRDQLGEGQQEAKGGQEVARTTLIVCALCALHLLGLVLLLDHPSAWLTDQPVLNADWGLHYHHLQSLAGFWKSDHRLWGYNPFFMAGYPSNTFQDISIKLFEYAALWSPLASPQRAFKIWVLLGTALVPALSYFTFRNLFAGRANAASGALLASLLATAYWWNSFPREMFFYGMVGFPLSCYVALLALSLLRLALASGRRFSAAHAAWLVACALLLPLQPQSVLVAVVPGVALALGSEPRRRGLWLAWGLLGAVLVNGFWLVPVVAHLRDDVSREIILRLPIYNSQDPWTFLKDYFTSQVFWTNRDTMAAERALRVAVLVLGGVGIARMARDGERAVALALGAAALSFFLVAYFGSFVPAFAAWQPLRFKIALDLALIVAAAFAVTAPSARAARPVRRRWEALALGLGMLGFGVNVVATEASGKMRLKSEFGPPATDVIEWLRSVVPRSGRVLFEESGDETDFVYGDSYLGSFLPHLTGHQLIGGPINLYNDRHHFAEFHSGLLFKRGIWRFTDEELGRYFDLYNIVAVVAFHPRSLERLTALQGLLTPVERSANVVLFRVNREPGWFLSGSGRVKAALNRLECSDVSGAEVVLKYHWLEGLRSEPDVRIEPVRLLDDPIPFIKIANPPSRFTLFVESLR